MNCTEFKAWLSTEDDHDHRADQEAEWHPSACIQCAKLYALDQKMEAKLAASFAEVDPPSSVLDKIRQDERYAELEEPGPARPWKMLAAFVATGLIMAVVFLKPFGGGIRSVAEIGSLAVANHLNEDLAMEFTTGQIGDVSAWFAERIGYPVRLPDMGPGVVFLGGRPCILGYNKAAYLLYERAGRKLSVFVIHPQGLRFDVEAGRIYSLVSGNHTVNLWSENGLVYATVIKN